MALRKYMAIAAILTLSSAAADSTADVSLIPQNVTAVYPQPDSRVDLGPNASPLGIQQISMVFTNSVSVNTACGETAHIYLQGDETPLQSVGISGVSVDLQQNNMGCVLFPYSCVANGSYRVTIPEGFWNLEEGGVSGAFELYYEILVPQTIAPTNRVQQELKEFRLEFPGYDEARVLDKNKFEFLRIASDDAYTIEVTEGKNDDGTPSNFILISLDSPVTQQGEYCLFIQADAAEGISYGANYPEDPTDFKADKNVEAIYGYTVSLTGIPEISPEEGVIEKFTDFELTVPSGFDFWFVNDKTFSFIYPVNADGSLAVDPICRLTGNRIGESEKIRLTINDNGKTVDSLTPEAGIYALQLAPGLFSGSWEGEFINSAPFIYYYEIPAGVSVDEIAVEHVKADESVYTLDGRKVSDSKKDLEEKRVPKGIYISGGRKILLTSGK